jgi:hypothetical protein
MLLDKGAKATDQDKEGLSPVHHCVSRDSGQNDTVGDLRK